MVMEAQSETTSADFLGYRFMLSKTNEMMRLVKPKSKQKLRIWKIGFKRKSVDDDSQCCLSCFNATTYEDSCSNFLFF